MSRDQYGRRLPGISAARPPRISPFWPNLFIRFIIADMSSNCFSRRFTSCTLVPDPAATRFLRLALRISGARRSFLVIEPMIAAWRLNTAWSTPAAPAASSCACNLPVPGNMPRIEEMLPILPIWRSCAA